MSSANRVRLALLKEASYGVTPVAGNFKTARFTSESLSGTPETTVSQQIRTDRMSSGNIVTGLTVGGAINFELAKESVFDELFESAMFNAWVTPVAVNVDLSINATLKTITRGTGTFTSAVRVGDIITLTGFTNNTNNTQVMIASIDDDEITYIGPNTLVTEAGVGTSYKVADYLEIGTIRSSFSMEKAFTDLTNKAILYRGQIAGEMSLNFAYGAPITGSLTFSGNDYDPVDAAVDFMTNGRTIDGAATTNSFNGSVDMPFIANSATGDFENSSFCIQSIALALNNNLTAQNCIGRVAPNSYSEGTAEISVDLSAYLADANWSILSAKLEQTPFSVGWMVKNQGGFYGFYLPAIQVSMDDPASGGQNQDVILSMKGVAKVGNSGEKALRIYRG